MDIEEVTDLILEYGEFWEAREAIALYKSGGHHGILCELHICPVHDSYEEVQFIEVKEED